MSYTKYVEILNFKQFELLFANIGEFSQRNLSLVVQEHLLFVKIKIIYNNRSQLQFGFKDFIPIFEIRGIRFHLIPEPVFKRLNLWLNFIDFIFFPLLNLIVNALHILLYKFDALVFLINV